MIGFDYGTSNCAVGIMVAKKKQLLSLGEHGVYMPSTLYSPSRDIIVNHLHQQLTKDQQSLFAKQRQRQLQKGNGVLHELRLDGIATDLHFGQQALAHF